MSTKLEKYLVTCNSKRLVALAQNYELSIHKNSTRKELIQTLLANIPEEDSDCAEIDDAGELNAFTTGNIAKSAVNIKDKSEEVTTKCEEATTIMAGISFKDVQDALEEFNPESNRDVNEWITGFESTALVCN